MQIQKINMQIHDQDYELSRGCTSREKPTAGAPNLLTTGELQLASDTNAGGNILSLAHCIFAGDNCTYCQRIATFARGNAAVVVIAGEFAMRQE
jgi:hypothetical protein